MTHNSSAAAGMRLPNLAVVGVSKAGTTSLFEYLGKHPQVGQSDLKELRYFTPLRYDEPLEPLDSYMQHFRDCTQRYAVEATPGYFYGGRPLARAMRETCPCLKVVLSLREPGDRCYSWFRFVKSRLRIPNTLTFEAYVDRCEQLHRQGVDGVLENQAYWGLGGGCYSEWLDDWTQEFGQDLKIVFFNDVVADSRAVMDDLFGWLGLEIGDAGTRDLGATNETVHYRNSAAQRLAVSLNRRGERFFRRHPELKRALRHAYYTLNRAKPEPGMSAEMRTRLDEFYRPDRLRLAEQLAKLGLELPSSWSTPVAAPAAPV